MHAYDISAAPAIRKQPPRRKGLPILGDLLELRRLGTIPMLHQACMELGDFFVVRNGVKDVYVVANPEYAEYVLQQNAKNYVKSTSYRRMRIVMGNGLLTSEGDLWRHHRKLIQPLFNRQWISSFADEMVTIIESQLQTWEAALGRRQSVDVLADLDTLTLQLVSHTVLGTDTGERSMSLGRAADALLQYVEKRRWAVLSLPRSLPTPGNLVASYHRRKIDRIAYEIIERQRNSTETNLVSKLLTARDPETGERMSDLEVRDHIATMLVAGHDTTAAALGWTLFLLASHEEVAKGLRAELDDVLGSRVPTAEDLGRMDYLNKVVQESMRLFPPAWVIGRRSVQADTLGEYEIPANAAMSVCPYLLHRNPKHFRNPDEFDPEHFAPAAVATRPRFAFIPFGAGARVCIGNHLAMVEMKLCLAMLLRRFTVSVTQAYEPKLVPAITLGPRAGMPLRLSLR